MSQPARGCPDGVLNKSVVAVLWDAQPNGARLSWGAQLKCSQTQFYGTAIGGVNRARREGRRQLQALVRQQRQGDPLRPTAGWALLWTTNHLVGRERPTSSATKSGLALSQPMKILSVSIRRPH